MSVRKITAVLAALVVMAGLAACNNGDKVTALTTAELADTVIANADFPVMLEHTEQADVEAFLPGVDFEVIEEITVWQQALTVHLVEVVIIKPKAGEMEAVMDFFKSRQAHLAELLALYPMQAAAAQAMVIGKSHGIAYLICHEDARAAETALLALLNEN